MKIGILTLPLNTNYGGILQAYALQTVLERMGHEVEVLGTPYVTQYISPLRHILSIVKRFFIHYFLKEKNIKIDRIKEEKQKTHITRKYTSIFIDKYIHTRIINKFQDIQPTDYDAIIVGSDQIWRSDYNHFWKNQKIDDVYLGFSKGWNIKRIAYAASFGIDIIDIKGKNLESCKKVIAKFDAISVREESGVKLCKEILGVYAVVMPDPTLLLSKIDYENLICMGNNYENIHHDSHNILLSYILDDNSQKTELRKKIAIEKHLVINITNKCDYYSDTLEYVPQPPVQEWLKAFLECDYVITDSFHACVFSIIFHKQFTVIANHGRGLSRFVTLLKMFGLERRMIESPSDYQTLPDIDYSKVDKIIESKQREAINFLKENLR